MSPVQIVILVAAVVGLIGLAAVAIIQAFRIPWPSGPRMTRVSALGTEVSVIDAPGSDGERLMLLDACTMATTSIFTAWHVYRPNDASASAVFTKFGVHFIEDTLMDDIQAALFPGQTIASYLGNASSRFNEIPLAVVRKSLASHVIATGQPVMHELLHALLAHFVPDAGGNHDHKHEAWVLVQDAARTTYEDLYAPKVQLMKKPNANT